MNPMQALVDRYLLDRRNDLTDACSLCESPMEELLLVALLCVGDENGAHLRLERPPYHGRRVAFGTTASLFLQHPVGAYRLDFAFLSDRGRIAVEVDGQEAHASREQRTADAARDRALKFAGWTVLRFTGSEVHRDADACAAHVARALGLTALAPPPPELVRAAIDPALARAARRPSRYAEQLSRCTTEADEEAVLRAAQESARARLGIGGA